MAGAASSVSAASSAAALRAAAFALLMPASVYLRDRGGDGDADGGGLTVRGVVAQEGIKFIVLVCRRACGALEGPGPGIGDALACGAQICPRLVFLGRGVLYGGPYRAFKAALSAGGRTGIVEAVNFRITYREHQRAVELTAGRDIPAVELNIRSRLYLDGDLGLAGDAYAAEGARRAGGRLPFL